jgi:hypothetical protein
MLPFFPLLLPALASRKVRSALRDHFRSLGSTTAAEPEHRKLVYSQRWHRDDPIVQLPPGAATEKSYTVTIGVDEVHAEKLSSSLGIKAPGPAGLSASLSSESGLQLKLSRQETRTSKLRLANTASDGYRRFAHWSVVHRLEVFTADDEPLASTEVIDVENVNLTWVDVQRLS